MSMLSPLKRRAFLRAMGLGAAALGLPHKARGASDCPKRIVFFYADDGSLPGSWEPLPRGGAPEATETAFELNTLMAPLEAYRSELILFENLDMVSVLDDPTAASNAHVNGSTHCMTAAHRVSDASAGGISIDQAIARHINEPTPVTRLSSLEVMGAWVFNDFSHVYTGPGERVPFLLRPPEVYERLFGDGVDLGEEAAARRALRRNAISSYLNEEQRMVARSLPRAAQEKLAQHQATRRSLEMRLGLGDSARTRPDRSILAPFEALNFRYNASRSERATNWHTVTQVNIDLAVAGLHADATRVANIRLHSPPDEILGFENGDFGQPDQHILTHAVNGAEADRLDPGARACIHRKHLAMMEKFAYLLDELAARTEPDGTTLLENTIVVYVSHIADGSHATSRLPWFTVGSGQGYFRTGRYLRFDRREDPSTGRNIGRAHNDFFISLAGAMGLELERFGTSHGSGPIHEMR